MTRLRSLLEFAALILTIIVCAAMLMVIGRNLRSNGQGQGGARAQTAPRPDDVVPADPATLDGAQIEGNRDAKIAVIEYSDFQCPFCGKFARDTFPEFEKAYVEAGEVLFAFRQFPLESIHRYALRAAEATECAGQQGQFWKMHTLTFADQRHLDDQSLHDRAVKAGLRVQQFDSCLGGNAAANVKADEETGRSMLVSGTPTFFFGTVQPDGRVKILKRISGAVPFEQIKTTIDGIRSSTRTQTRKSN